MAKTKVDISKRSEKNTSVSMALLESYRKGLYAVKDFFDSASKDLKDMDDIELQLKISLGICSLGEKIGKNIESLDKLEDKVKKEERETITRRGGSESSLFEE
jgi:DNA-binding MltR family transcriptional regulator